MDFQVACFSEEIWLEELSRVDPDAEDDVDKDEENYTRVEVEEDVEEDGVKKVLRGPASCTEGVEKNSEESCFQYWSRRKLQRKVLQ